MYGYLPLSAFNFSPSTLGSSLWLYSLSTNITNAGGGAVSQWNDISGNNRHVTQANSANRPTFISNGFGNTSGINFDGVNDWLTRTSWGGSLAPCGTNQSFTVLSYLSTGGSGPVDRSIISWKAAAAGRVTFAVTTTGALRLYREDSGGINHSFTSSLSTGASGAYCARYNGTTNTITLDILSTTETSSTLSSLGSIPNCDLFVGAANGSGVDPLSTNVGEILVLPYFAENRIVNAFKNYARAVHV